jgi:predicted transcriptional regulator
MSKTNDQGASLSQVAEIVSAYVSNNSVPSTQIGDLIISVHDSLMNVGEKPPETLKPAVPIKQSVKPDYIVCLEDGKKLKMLKRHLRVSFNLSPDEYRQKWGLPSDYPIVAPKYAAQRSELAKKIGLGKGAAGRRKGRKKAAA